MIAAGPELAFDEIPGLGPAGGFTPGNGTTEPVCERIVTKAIGVARIKS